MQKLLIYTSVFLIFAGVITTPCAADTTEFNKRITAIEKKYRAIKDLSANFTQSTHIELINRTVKRRGSFLFKRGGKFRIEYSGKNQKTYVSDGKTLWIFIPGDLASHQSFKVNDNNIPKEVLSFFGGYADLKKDFLITRSNAFKLVTKKETPLHLVPKRKGSQFKSLDALFGSEGILKKLVVENRSGNKSEYHFKKIHIDKNLKNSTFSKPGE